MDASARGGDAVNVDSAYRHCEAITRRSAANFYYGIRLLAPERRRAMCAVYAFARRIDDIGDGTLPREERLRLLDTQAGALARLGCGSSNGDPVMAALADAHERFAVPADALLALIEGVRMDVDGTTYETFGELVLYCRRVAGAIGRACLAIFALRDLATTESYAALDRLADDLGVALQLTNILRDVREDALNGRVYLPAEDLRRFGLIADGAEREAPALLVSLAQGADREEAQWLHALLRFQASRAQQWYHRGMALPPRLDRRSAACVLAMASIYRRLLERIEADPERALRRRMALPAHEKAWVALSSMFAGNGR